MITFTQRNQEGLHCRFCNNTYPITDLYETSPTRGIVCYYCKAHLEEYFQIEKDDNWHPDFYIDEGVYMEVDEETTRIVEVQGQCRIYLKQHIVCEFFVRNQSLHIKELQLKKYNLHGQGNGRKILKLLEDYIAYRLPSGYGIISACMPNMELKENKKRYDENVHLFYQKCGFKPIEKVQLDHSDREEVEKFIDEVIEEPTNLYVKEVGL